MKRTPAPRAVTTLSRRIATARMATARNATARITTAWIATALLAAASFVSAETPEAQPPAGTLLEATAIAEQLLAQRTHPVTAALERVEARRIALESADRSVVREEIPAAVHAYAASVGDLARHPSPETLDALTAAVQHEEPTVRLAALTALREGASHGRPHSTALQTARALITADPDPLIRRQAFEAYCRWGDQDDVLALSQTLGRQPGPVRDLAVREWLRIERERQ
ncbi:MAG: HEAT repeat domain-containing protein [Acidobacteriota bacterium]